MCIRIQVFCRKCLRQTFSGTEKAARVRAAHRCPWISAQTDSGPLFAPLPTCPSMPEAVCNRLSSTYRETHSLPNLTTQATRKHKKRHCHCQAMLFMSLSGDAFYVFRLLLGRNSAMLLVSQDSSRQPTGMCLRQNHRSDGRKMTRERERERSLLTIK